MMPAGDGGVGRKKQKKQKAPRRADRRSDFLGFFLTRELREL